MTAYRGDEAEYTPKGKPRRRRTPEPVQGSLFANTQAYLADAQARVDAIPKPPEMPVRDTRPRKVVEGIRVFGQSSGYFSVPLRDAELAASVAEQRRKSIQAGMDALDGASRERAERIAQLVPIARHLAEASERTDTPGITMADVRDECQQRGIFTGDEPGRSLSWLGAVMKAAGLHTTGEYRRSHILRSHGIPQRVWRLPRNPVESP